MTMYFCALSNGHITIAGLDDDDDVYARELVVNHRNSGPIR